MTEYPSLSTSSQPLTTELQVNDRSLLQDALPSNALTSSDSSSAALASSDLNKTAMFWRNAATGEGRAWVMEGTKPVVDTIALSTRSADWKIVSTNDYNQDGQTDFLYRQDQTGQLQWSVSNGTATPTVVTLRDAVPDLSWEVVSSISYSPNTPKVDLLWRNNRTGELAWWRMQTPDAANGLLRYDSLVVTTNIVPSLDLKIVGTYDFNRDGQADILWRDPKTGQNGWWLMQGLTVQSTVKLATADLNWNIVGIGDYNRDRQADLLWRSTTGQMALWVMNGDKLQEGVWLPSEADLNWQIVGVNDRYTAPANRPLVNNLNPPPSAPTVNVDISVLKPATAQSGPTFTVQNTVNAGAFALYQFTIGQSGIFTANLTNLSADADVRLIQDGNGNQNGNQKVDDGEVKAWQWERGLVPETIRSFLNAGTYLVQVFSYSGQTANYNLATNFTPTASDSQKFSIILQYDSSVTSLSSVGQAAINQAAQAAVDFWQNAIPTRSAITNSSDLTITISGRSLDFNTFAVAGPVFSSDRKTVTIASGNAYINTQRLDFFTANISYLKLIMIHEFAHVLGFGTLWEPIKFDTGNGTSLTVGKTLVNRTTATYTTKDSLGNATYASWAYGDLVGTRTPTAVPIEPGIFAHWDETRFGKESLTPFAEAVGVVTPVSLLTLAALRDLGWNINYGAAQLYQL